MMQSCGQSHREAQSPGWEKEEKKKKAKNRVSKAGGHFSVGLREHHRHAGGESPLGAFHFL